MKAIEQRSAKLEQASTVGQVIARKFAGGRAESKRRVIALKQALLEQL